MKHITSLMNKFIKDGFTERETKSINGYIRLIAFVISAIPLGYIFVLFYKHYVFSIDDIFMFIAHRTSAEKMLVLVGVLCSPVVVVFIGFYWLYRLLDSLYVKIVLPLKSIFVEPTKNNIRSFWKNIKNTFMNSRIWHLHMRWFNLFEKLATLRLLFPLLSYLETELAVKERTQNFQVESLVLYPPHDSPEFISQIQSRYERLESFVIQIWLLASLAIFLVGLVILFQIEQYTRIAIPLSVIIFWCALLWIDAFAGFIHPIRVRQALWHKEYQSARDRQYRESTIRQLVQELAQPDSHVERLKQLSELQSKELRELANEIIENETEKQSFLEMINNQEKTFDKMFQKYNESSERKNEIRERAKKPAAIIEGLSINLVAAIIYTILTAIGGFVLSWFGWFGCACG